MPNLDVARTGELSTGRLEELHALLVHAFKGDFSNDDWNHALGGWHVTASDGAVVAHAAIVERTIGVGERFFRTGYVEAVATAPARQGEGLGTIVMERVARILRTDFEFGALATGGPAFYEQLGWERWQGPTFVRHPRRGLVRTAAADDAILVLRYGATSDVDLELPISCEVRPGDVW